MNTLQLSPFEAKGKGKSTWKRMKKEKESIYYKGHMDKIKGEGGGMGRKGIQL